MKHLTLFITTLPLLLPLASQTEGAEGTKVTNGLTLQDAESDAIKTQNVNSVTSRNAKTEWLRKPKSPCKVSGTEGEQVML